ncbi:hypothetical protein [Streptomyces cucumeris]|uniref:hypothetical protein n=1 Tax=Streptomyces cucumeris TaxID=2962890 RepID=UPI003EB981DB
MVSGFLSEFGRKVAERWATQVILPGLLFTSALAVASALGQRRWADTGLLWRTLGAFAAVGGAGQQGAGSARTVMLVIGVVAVSVAVALVARALGGPVTSLLSGRWPFFLRPLDRRLTAGRLTAWRRCDAAYEAAREAGADAHRLGELAAERNAVALTVPRRPTWTGDRLAAPAVRVRDQYALDLTAAWPRLWLLLPDTTRQPLTDSRQGFDEAAALGGWAVLYGALGALWWPSAVVGLGVAVVCRRRARETAEAYAELVEAAVDVHLDELLDRFDDEFRPVRPGRGAAVTERFRKGV